MKEDQVVCIKTTGEQVFILDISDPSPKLGDKDYMLVTVRRPVAGQNGISHVVETFRESELESLEEQQARFLAERKGFIEKFTPGAGTPSDETKGFLA